MAEAVVDVRGLDKRAAYAEVERALDALLAGVDDEIAIMSTIASVVHHGFGHLWTGFYRVVQPERRLRVGPYQGSVGCLEIEFGRGVCGTAARERRTIVVPDVQAFPGHIVCDALARSEIVVPVASASGELLAVFDLDSATLDTFDDVDAQSLEALVHRFFAAPDR
jgi:L-methionine (R)-S-oxide reductase